MACASIVACSRLLGIDDLTYRGDAGDATACPSWTLDHASGVNILGEVLDSNASILYVAGERATSEAGDTLGYLALVDACSGELLVSYDPPKFAGSDVRGLNDPGFVGNVLYARVFAAAGALRGGYLGFDTLTRTFSQHTPQLAAFSTSGADETWQMATGAGALWFSGEQDLDDLATQKPVLVEANGDDAAACATALDPDGGTELYGRALTVSGNDVYEFALSTDAVLRHFDATTCTVAPCSCSPTWTSPPLPLTNQLLIVFHAHVVGTRVYFVGTTPTANLQDRAAFASYYDLDANAFAVSPFIYNPTSDQDALFDVKSDGKNLYATSGEGIVNSNLATGTSKVVVLDLDARLVSSVEVPSLRATGGIELVSGGFIVSGGNRTVRCTTTACP